MDDLKTKVSTIRPDRTELGEDTREGGELTFPDDLQTGIITLSVVIPTYNEERTVIQVLEKVAAQRTDSISIEVIVVDDGSSDRTRELLSDRSDLYTRLVTRTTNGGKGTAVRDGLNEATGQYVLIQDADLEYDPDDFSMLLKPISSHEADVVLGSRFVAPQLTRVFYFTHKIGNLLITLLFNICNNTTFTDIYCGYLVYRRELIDPSTLRISGWAQHAEMLTLLARTASKIYEVPVSYHGRTYGEGKKIKARDFLGVLAAIVLERLRRRHHHKR